MTWLQKISYNEHHPDDLASLYHPVSPYSFKNWLQKLAASKEEHLFNKYIKKVEGIYSAPLRDNVGKPVDAASLLQSMIRDAVHWNRKYAEWHVYQAIEHLAKDKDLYGWNHYTRSLSLANDYLERGGQIPSLKTTPEQLFEASDNWHRMVAARGAGQEYKTNDVWGEMSNGWRLVNVPGQDLAVEGYLMGHCSGQYCQQVYNGTYILSLRDKNNLPHVTMEVNPITSDPSTSGRVDTGNYQIEQIKGKENRPQPQYANYVTEAIQLLTQRFPFTLSFEGALDLLDWYPDNAEAQAKIMEIIQDQKQPETWSLRHNNPAFVAHEIARYGLLKFLQSDDDLKRRRFAHYVDEYLEYIVERNPDTVNELVDDLQDRKHYFIADEVEIDGTINTSATMTEEQFQEVIDELKRGKIYWGGMNEDMAQLMQRHSEAYWAGDFYVDEFLLDYDESYIKDAYIKSVNEEFDLENVYDGWEKYYIRQRYLEGRKRQEDRVQRVMQAYNIVIPPEADADLLMGRFISGYLHYEWSDQEWAKQMQEMIDRDVFSRREWDATQKRIDMMTTSVVPMIARVVPGFDQLDPVTIRMFVVRHVNKDTIDQEMINEATAMTQNIAA